MITGIPIPANCHLRFSELIESALWHQWAQGPQGQMLADRMLGSVWWDRHGMHPGSDRLAQLRDNR